MYQNRVLPVLEALGAAAWSEVVLDNTRSRPEPLRPMSSHYLSHFGLAESPFSIAPAPRFLYMSQRHQEALAHLLYGLGGEGGFVLLTGEVGAGKTTICRALLERIPETCDLAYIFNPKLTVEELLSTICAEFGIEVAGGSVKTYVDAINAHLLEGHARGRQAVLIIDEAQNLSADVLEQMRLLTNLETSERKLLQIILLGQPELAAMLERPELRQLAQRIVARYHLEPLSRDEVAAYVQHRLEVAGAKRRLFPAALAGPLYRLTGGVPRLLNLVCDRALLGACVVGKEKVDRSILRRAAREVLPKPTPAWRTPLLLAGLALLAAGGAWWMRDPPVQPVAVVNTPKPVVSPASPPASMLPLTAPTQAAALSRATLLGAWGVQYRGGDLCREAAAARLHCREGMGGLEELRRVNRPAILQLTDAQGREFPAALLGLETDAARFSLDGTPQKLALTVLAQQWTGQYILLWRPPPEVTASIRPGDQGPAVDWLRRQMQGLPSATPDVSAPGTPYDENLLGQVKQFQLQQGLAPDGRVGQRTLLPLLGRVETDAPRLDALRGGK